MRRDTRQLLQTRGSEATSPLNLALGGEMRERIAKALAELNPLQRQAVESNFYDNMSHSEIAELMGRPLGTVKTYIRQGLIHLRDALRIK